MPSKCPKPGRENRASAERSSSPSSSDEHKAETEQSKYRLVVTFFPNESAQRKSERQMSLDELRDLIQHKTAASKAELPWLKLAAFGDERTDKNCLRHNDNVLSISGVELDYDDKQITFDEAIAIAEKARLRALFYTSANYAEGEPKWRVLLPTSQSLPPDERAKLVARINGLYGGAFDGASFTLSQAYYFGSVNSNPAHRAVVTDGDFVDLRGDLDAAAISKDKSTFEQFADSSESPNWSELIEGVLSGENYHEPLTRLAAKLTSSGMDARAAANLLRGLMEASAGPRDGRWQARYDDINRAVSSAREKYEEPSTELMQASAEFVADFTPPDYLIDGLMQRRYVYSFTGPTGSGKTAIALLIAMYVATGGLSLSGQAVEKGRVLFFAGENPDDVRSRWIMLCEVMNVDPNAVDVVFMPFTLNLSQAAIRRRIDDEAAARGPFALLIVDTSASYYSGSDENDNVALGNHARMLRTFVNLPGGPTVLVTCHPTKTPNMDNLLPRGGGAFLAEVDGNLVCIIDRATMVAEVTWHGKFRGADFAPFSFKLVPSKSERLVDSKGRSIWTVVARPISAEEQEAIEAIGHLDQNFLLKAMLARPGRSLNELAEDLEWLTKDGRAKKWKVLRIMKDLQKMKLAEKRRDGHHVLTAKGEKEAKKIPELQTVSAAD